MSKKYSSGAEIQADIDKLIELRAAMSEETSTKFTKALLTKSFVNNLLNLSNHQIRELARVIEDNYDRLLETANKRLEKNNQKSTKTAEQSMPIN